ncbi:MAG: hypothetical protein QOD77_170 [Thermoplasmata archaeon]|jgi:hypothetical protein|nr:hypothetical protein [Thermoplasmata archaeon]
MPSTSRARTSFILALLLVAGALPALPVATAAAPVVTSANLLDEDNNGHLDAVLLTFDQAIRSDSVRPSDWTLGSAVARSVERQSSTQFKLFFQEALALDGNSNAINIAYTREADQPLENLATPFEDFTASTVPASAKKDMAKPILMAAYAVEATNYIVAVFSEAVTDNAGAILTHDEFVLTAGGAGAPAIDTTVAVTALGSPARVFRIPLNAAWTTAQLAHATKPTLAISGTNLVKDLATPANNNPTGMAAVPVGAPFIERVMANPGDDLVVVEFNGPVADSTGTAPLPATSSGDLTLRFQEGSGGGAIVTTDMVNPVFSDRVQLRVDAPLRPADFAAGTISKIVAQTDKVFAWKGASSVASYKVPAGAAGNLADADVYTNPYPTRLETVDRDLNGCIDAIQMTWNDDILDASLAASTGWVVVFPKKASGTPLPTTPPAPGIVGATLVSAITGAGVSPTLSPGVDDRVTFLTFTETDAATGCDLSLPAPLVGSTGPAGVRLLPRVSHCDGLDSGCTGLSPTDRAGRGIGASRGAFNDAGVLFRLPVIDSARPVLMTAATRDLPSSPDGQVDQILLSFSEPMKLGTLKQAQWNVRVPANQAQCPVPASTAYTVTSVGSASGTSGDTESLLLLGIQPSGTPDTGCILDIAYGTTPNALESSNGQVLPAIPANSLILTTATATAGGANSITAAATNFATAGALTGMRVDVSRAGTPLGSFTVTGVAGTTLTFSPAVAAASAPIAAGDVATVYRERDGAGPVLLDGRLVGAVGSRFATATFSEAVLGVNGNAVTNTDLTYKNNGAGGASGISCVATPSYTSGTCTPDPAVTTNPAQLSLTLNAVLAGGDVGTGKDCVQIVNYIPDENSLNPANPGVRDAAGNVGQPLEPSGPCRIFSTGGTVATVLAIETLDTSNPPNGAIDAIRVTFTGPVNDDFTDGVAKWKVKFGTTTATINTVQSGGNCGGSTLTPDVANDAVVFLCIAELTDTSDPANPLIPNTGALPLVSYSGTLLAGATDGLPVATFTDRAATDAALPVLITVRGGAGRNTVELRFSEDVVDATTKGPLKASNFLYSNGNGGSSTCSSGASNIVDVLPVTGFNDRFTGVLNTPAGQPGLHYDDIVGCPTVASRDEVRALASSIIEKVGLRAMTDSTPRDIQDIFGPDILSARFIDAPAQAGAVTGADGTIDAVEVRFREYVSDAAAAFGTSATVTGQWAVKVNDGSLKTLKVKAVVSSQNGVLGDSCTDTQARPLILWPGEVQPPTSGPSSVNGVDDDTLFLCLENTVGVSTQGTLGLGTGMVGTLSYAAANPTARIKDRSGNGFADITLGSARTVTDGARPVVLNTCRPEVTPALRCTGVSPESADLDNDGLVDALRVVLSEPVKDDTYKQVEWDLGSGFAITGMDTGVTVDDATIFLKFNEGATPDTGRGRASQPGLPDLTFSSTGTMADRAGNRIRAVQSGACGAATDTHCADERDGVEPVVVRSQAEVGSDLVTIALSEPVQGTGPVASGRPITTSDIAYQNKAGAGDGATGIVAISHVAGESVLTIKLDKKVTEFDRLNDRFVFVTGSIKEAQCTVSATTPSCYRQLAMTRLFVPIAFAGGADPKPAAIDDLDAPAEDVTATSVRLTWTAPDDTDLASYQIYFCECSFAGTIPTGALTPPTSVVIPTPDPGEAQEVVITGLTTGKTYNFVIRAIDNSGNTAELSNVATALVEAPDTEAPDMVLALQDLAASTPLGSVALVWDAPGDDGDQGTVAGYRIAVADRPIAASDFEDFETTDYSLNPAGLADAGDTQRATIFGLIPGDEVFVYILAYDDASPPNESPLSGAVRATVGGTTTDLADPGPITDLTATAATDSTVELEWRAPGDDGLSGGPVTGYDVYYSTAPFASSTRPSVPRASDVTLSPRTPTAAGLSQRATVGGLESDTVYYFMVLARDDATKTSASNVVNRATLPGVGELTIDDLFAANKELNENLEVTHEDGINIVSFTIPEAARDAAKGLQVWRAEECDDANYVLVNTYDADDSVFEDGRFEEPGATTDCYKVTLFTKDSQDSALGPKANASDIERFAELDSASASDGGIGTGMWLMIGGGVLLAILLAALLVFLVRRRGGGQQTLPPEETAEGGEAGEGWSEVPEEGAAESVAPAADTWSEPAPAEAEPEAPLAAPPAAAATTAATTHYVTCPRCSSPFSAVGVKPLAIQCPSCGVRGTLK